MIWTCVLGHKQWLFSLALAEAIGHNLPVTRQFYVIWPFCVMFGVRALLGLTVMYRESTPLCWDLQPYSVVFKYTWNGNTQLSNLQQRRLAPHKIDSTCVVQSCHWKAAAHSGPSFPSPSGHLCVTIRLIVTKSESRSNVLMLRAKLASGHVFTLFPFQKSDTGNSETLEDGRAWALNDHRK